jgi:two-component system, OmpR family, KDP operon response regulator KdpE
VSRPPARSRILLVEDETINRDLIRAALSRARHPVLQDVELIEVDSIAAARARLAELEIDLVLLDVQLSDGSGLILAREIVQLGQPRPAIIALSAGVLPEQRSAADEAGCDAFLAKPVSMTTLYDELARLLQVAQAERAAGSAGEAPAR